jgi:hypothetical protein
MLVGHQHKPGVVDAGHCRACAGHAGLLDHYRQVHQQEAALGEAHGWARAARRRADAALCPPAPPSCWPSSPCSTDEPPTSRCRTRRAAML